jgi:MYXO-CTERM domain-containing protein
VKVGFGTFTVTSANTAGLSTNVYFGGRAATTAANYFQDNVPVQEPSVDGLTPLVIGTGGVIPEPATLSLAGLAGLAMIRRRRA